MSDAHATDEYATIADLYDSVGPYRDRADVPFYVEMATAAAGPVLELGCGTGRILIPAARAGASMVGLDASPSMLAVCRARLLREDTEVRSLVRLVHGDMRAFTLDATFALVMVPFRAFQHLVTVDDQLACLADIRRHLTVGGRVILDVFNPSLEAMVNRREGEESGDEPEFETPDGRRVVRRHRIVAHDRFRQVNHVQLIYYVTHPDGRTERLVHAFGMRYLFRYELEHLLARSGFAVEQVYSGYDRSEYGSQYPGELVVIAGKVAPAG